MKIKMLDLSREFIEYRREYMDALESVMQKGAFILGEYVNNFEVEFAKYLDVKYAIGVANGTDALLLSLIALDIKEGDEIITTPFTFFATVETIIEAGAKPIFVDIDTDFNINVNKIEEKINEHTKAILPVHLYGNPANMDKIIEIANKHNIDIIEDCAQSVGAKYKNRYTGTFGIAGTVSFFPTKNLGCAGDGGAIITNDETFYNKIKMLRVHGSSKKYHHDFVGYNSRLDALQASLLSVKLKYLNIRNEKRRTIAKFYNEHLNNKIEKPKILDNMYQIFHQYTVLVDNRDELRKYLSEAGISTAIHYPLPVHKQTALLYIAKDVSCPIAEDYANHVISLPIYPEIKDEELEYIVMHINKFYG